MCVRNENEWYVDDGIAPEIYEYELMCVDCRVICSPVVRAQVTINLHRARRRRADKFHLFSRITKEGFFES